MASDPGREPDAPRIFVSYRRGDTTPYARNVHDRLVERFGKDHVFFDVDDIRPGADFAEVIAEALKDCDVLLAVIGPDWLTRRGALGRRRRRLDDPSDFIHLELRAALRAGIVIIPVLVGNARMPARHQLPQPLAPFANRQALELSDRRWSADIRTLIEAVARARRHWAQHRRDDVTNGRGDDPKVHAALPPPPAAGQVDAASPVPPTVAQPLHPAERRPAPAAPQERADEPLPLSGEGVSPLIREDDDLARMAPQPVSKKADGPPRTEPQHRLELFLPRLSRLAAPASRLKPMLAGLPRLAPHFRPELGTVALATVFVVFVVLVVTVVELTTMSERSSESSGISQPSTSNTTLQPLTTAPAPPPLRIAASLPSPGIVKTIPLGLTPGFVAIAPNGKFAYIAHRATGFITVVDTTVDEKVATISIPDGPQYLAFAPDGKRLYVSVFNDVDRSINRVAVLDTATNTVLTTIQVGSRPLALAVSPDGSQIYVPNHDSGTVSVIDSETNSLVTDVRVNPSPHSVEFAKDGRLAYIADDKSNLVSVVDTATRTVAGEVTVQLGPNSVVVAPSAPLAANVNYDSDSVTVIDTSTNKVIATIPVGSRPLDVAWAPDGRHLYVTNVRSNSLTAIAADEYRVTTTIPTGKTPTSIAVLPDGSKGYVANYHDGTLTILDLDG